MHADKQVKVMILLFTFARMIIENKLRHRFIREIRKCLKLKCAASLTNKNELREIASTFKRREWVELNTFIAQECLDRECCETFNLTAILSSSSRRRTINNKYLSSDTMEREALSKEKYWILTSSRRFIFSFFVTEMTRNKRSTWDRKIDLIESSSSDRNCGNRSKP